MRKLKLPGVHRVSKRLADGSLAEYHYAWRGGPRIWDKSSAFKVGSVDYLAAYQDTVRFRQDVKGSFQEIIEKFLASRDFNDLGDRTKKDHLKNIAKNGGIEERFGSAPIVAFESKKIRSIVITWRDSFSPGTGDNLFATLQRIVSFAFEHHLLGEHRLLKVKHRVKEDRSQIVWTRAEINYFVQNTPRYVGNLLIAATETGFRPGDLMRFGHKHLEETGGGHQRLLLKTNKKKKFASVPVSDTLADLIAMFPADQSTFIVNEAGLPFANANSLGKLVSKWRDELGMRKELHFYDARGTAVTKLVRAGLSIGELAVHMGWSLDYAGQMLARYTRLDADMTDGVREKLDAQDKKEIEAAARRAARAERKDP
jgi:integrase